MKIKRKITRLEAERRKLGFTQKVLAQITGIVHTTISDIESGRVNPTKTELGLLAVALNVGPPHILTRNIELSDPEEIRPFRSKDLLAMQGMEAS